MGESDLQSVFDAYNGIEEEEDDLGIMLNKATYKNPQKSADIIELKEKSGYDQTTVELEYDEVKRKDQLNGYDIGGIRTKNPKFRDWLLADQANVDISADDHDNLRETETVFKEQEEIEESAWNILPNTAVDLAVGGFNLLQGMAGGVNLLVDPYIEAANSIIPESFKDAVSPVTDAFEVDTLGANEYLTSFHSEGRKQGDAEVQAAKGFLNSLYAYADRPASALGLITQSAPLMLGIAGAVRTVAASMLARAGIVAGTPEAAAFLAQKAVALQLVEVSAAAEGVLSTGLIYTEARAKGRTYEESALPSLIAGVLTSLVSIGSSKIPGLKDVETQFGTAGMHGKGIAFRDAGKNFLKGIFKEGPLEEVPQEMQETFFSNMAQGLPLMEGVTESAAGALVAGSGTGGLMSIGTSSIEAITKDNTRGLQQAWANNDDQEFLTRVITLAQGSLTNPRTPEPYKEYVENTSNDRKVYINADAVEELKIELDQSEIILPQSIATQLDKALEEGTDVVVSMSDFMAEIAVNEDIITGLRPHIRTRANGQSETEMKQTLEDDSLSNLINTAREDQQLKTEADEIWEEVRDQIVATGRQSATTAKYSAMLHSAYAVTKSKELGIGVREAYQKMFPNIEIRGAKDVPLTQKQILDMGKEKLDDIKVSVARDVEGTEGFEEMSATKAISEISDRVNIAEELIRCVNA